MTHDRTSASAVAVAQPAPIRVPLAGRMLYHLFPFRRRVILDNLRRVFGATLDEDDIVDLAQAHYGHLWKLAGEFLNSQDKLLSTSDYNKVTAEYYVAVTGLYLNYPEAEVQVDRFVKNHAEHPKAQLIYSDLGKYYYESGNYEKAITYLEKAVNLPGAGAGKLESTYRLAMSYYNSKQPDLALPLFKI